MADLQSQLDKLQRLIALKNDQLARLEAQGAAGQAPVAAALPGEPAPANPAANAEADVKPAPAAVDTAPASVPDAQPRADGVLGNPLLLWLIAGSAFLVLLLLLVLLMRKRKAQEEAEKHLRMARALAEEEQGAGLDIDADSFEGLEVSAPSVTLSPAVVAASAAAATAAEKPAVALAEPAPQPDTTAALLAEVEQSLQSGRLNHAAELLETALAAEPERDVLRLKLMEVYARQGDHSAFVEQERVLPATEQNVAQVDELKGRFPAMLGLAAAGLGAAALAAEMDEQYVQGLLQDPPEAPVVEDTVPEGASEAEPEVLVEPDFVAEQALDDIVEPEAEAISEVPSLDASDLDSDFDLSLGEDLPEEDPLTAPVLDEVVLDEPVLDEVQVEEQPAAVEAELQAYAETDAETDVAADADADFEAMLAQAEPQPVADLDDFDLDVSEPVAPAVGEETPVDVADELAAFDSVPEFDPVSDFDMPSDFDLSLSLEDDSPAAKSFASELDDVNAELDKLSQSLESPSLEPHFTSEDAAAQPEPEPLDDLDFDFFSGSDEVATKLDLARAYIDMGDNQGARDILDEVVKDGDDSQRQEANEMLSRLV